MICASSYKPSLYLIDYYADNCTQEEFEDFLSRKNISDAERQRALDYFHEAKQCRTRYVPATY